MTMTDIEEQRLEGEIVSAIKGIAVKKSALTAMERSFSARRRRRSLMCGVSGVAALAFVSLTFYLLHSPVPVVDNGGIRGGDMASDKVERLMEAGKYEEALKTIDEAREGLSIDEGLSEEAGDYQRQVIADERRKLDSLENILRRSR